MVKEVEITQKSPGFVEGYDPECWLNRKVENWCSWESDGQTWLCWREVAAEKKIKKKKSLAGITMYKGMEKHLLVC